MLGQLPIPRLRQNPRLVDTAVSSALLASMLLSIATRAAQPGQLPNSWVTYLTAVTMALPYPFHRRYPLAASRRRPPVRTDLLERGLCGVSRAERLRDGLRCRAAQPARSALSHRLRGHPLTRNTVAAIVGGLVWIQFVEVGILENAFPSMARWLPADAAQALTTVESSPQALSQGVAALVLVGWAAVLVAMATRLSTRRELR